MTLHHINRFHWCTWNHRKLEIPNLVVLRESDVFITEIRECKFFGIPAQYWAMTGFAERFNTVKCLKSSLLTLKTLPKPGDCPSLGFDDTYCTSTQNVKSSEVD